MKRILLIALLMLSGALYAQTTDSSSVGGRVLGDEPRERTPRERNVLGAPVYYDTLGNIIGQTPSGDGFYHRPRHHFRNRLDSEYNSFFFETELLFGHNDAAFGLQLTWLPTQWGLYGSALRGINHYYFTFGPALRLSDCGDYLDWQLYGGLVATRRPGFEVGFRLAGPRSRSGFSWTSLSVGGGYANRQGYMTIGFSLAIMPEMLFLFWL